MYYALHGLNNFEDKTIPPGSVHVSNGYGEIILRDVYDFPALAFTLDKDKIKGVALNDLGKLAIMYGIITVYNVEIHTVEPFYDYIPNPVLSTIPNPSSSPIPGPILNPVPDPVPSPVEDLVFDEKFYADKYPDLKTRFGYDRVKLFKHWKTSGIKEGRTFSCVFDPDYYLKHNSDVAKAVGANNYEGAYQHFITSGYNEGRRSSPIYDGIYYKNCYSDLKTYDFYKLIYHFLTYGIHEGRSACLNFEPIVYAIRYPDLFKNFGNLDYKPYFTHYLISGIREGRSGLYDYNFIPNPIENLIFDEKFYADKYPDLKANLGYNKAKLFMHWKTTGIKEGRTSSYVFDPDYYLKNNSDVAKAVGANNYKGAYEHFITSGYNEGRKSSPIYHGSYYQNCYSDLKTHDFYKLIYHFITYGIHESRNACLNFEPIVYAIRYPDLFKALGNSDYKPYFTHYLISGIREGRSGLYDYNFIPNPIENLIFDEKFYADKYPDLKAKFGYDRARLFMHWKVSGIKEGRTSSYVFDPVYYLKNNSDVSNAVGANNYEGAYQHFITSGYNEGRRSSPIYDGSYYQNYNPELRVYDFYKLIEHFLVHGIHEGRRACSNFGAKVYVARYSDLFKNFGTSDYKPYFTHYLISGIKEGRLSY
ncbi:hypothetical protein [Clostridium cellulovorans]|uniref:Uncharacterized protein n=1 Tax=Clostridium cellulovorans (strain ATCC 35296 / DSM 3052 / OCM 3 / 743B) TaxID=573061 RepID=D9SNS9_CLOC7|nr:hypothetical protein [Clostridium cellulovorans]ADL49950.1 hypothetical protein Clocel_0162 [Clostridium cellulovorans 743B]